MVVTREVGSALPDTMSDHRPAIHQEDPPMSPMMRPMMSPMAGSRLSAIAACAALLLFAATASSEEGPAPAEETVGTLTLDGFSFISFGNEEILPIPSGSTIRFRFEEPAADGSARFRIEPEDVSISPISTSRGTLEYGMGAEASGTMRPTKEGRVIRFTAEITARLVEANGRSGLMVYTVPFSTESASSKNLAGTDSVSVKGMRMLEDARYVRLVGATVNRGNAYPKPGAAVYTMLSGSFDRVPEARRGAGSAAK